MSNVALEKFLDSLLPQGSSSTPLGPNPNANAGDIDAWKNVLNGTANGIVDGTGAVDWAKANWTEGWFDLVDEDPTVRFSSAEFVEESSEVSFVRLG